MLLKEDYFNDLKLTDEDITYSDGNDISNYTPYEQIYDNAADFHDAMVTEYTHSITISVRMENYDSSAQHAKVNETTHLVKKLQYIFDMYGSTYSKPVLYDACNGAGNRKKSNFIEFRGYNDELIKYIETVTLLGMGWQTYYLMFYINLPKVRTYIAACRFISNIMKCIWRNEKDKIVFNAFSVEYNRPSPWTIEELFISRSTYQEHIFKNTKLQRTE